MPRTNGPDVEATELLSIGELADAAGISPDTLRVWERRYGRPDPVRLPSGHRRYSPEQLVWLRRVAEALARGHRPGKVVALDDTGLDALLADESGTEAVPAAIDDLLALVREYDGLALTRELGRAWTDLGPRAFLHERITPLLETVGRCWADGELEVRHEHFLSEVLEDLLRALRRSLEVVDGGRPVLLTTLQGETHGLGLQMAAIIVAIVGAHPRLLGTDTPNEEIAQAARETGAQTVLLSISLATGGVETDRRVADLRKLLPREIAVIVGGAGARRARRGPRGVEYVDGLDGLEGRLRDS